MTWRFELYLPGPGWRLRRARRWKGWAAAAMGVGPPGYCYFNISDESLETSSAKPIDRENPFSRDTMVRATAHRKTLLFTSASNPLLANGRVSNMKGHHNPCLLVRNSHSLRMIGSPCSPRHRTLYNSRSHKPRVHHSLDDMAGSIWLTLGTGGGAGEGAGAGAAGRGSQCRLRSYRNHAPW